MPRAQLRPSTANNPPSTTTSATAPVRASGRSRVPTEKQQQKVTEEATKKAAATKKAQLDALRAHQAREELHGFKQLSAGVLDAAEEAELEDDPKADDPESEDEPNGPSDGISITTAAHQPMAKPVNCKDATPAVDMPLQPLNGVPPTTSKPTLARRVNKSIPPAPVARASTAQPAALHRPDGRHEGYSSLNANTMDYIDNGKTSYYSTPANQHQAHPDLEAFGQQVRNEARGIRKQPPVTASAETTVRTKKVKTEGVVGTGSRGRVCSRDFDGLQKGMVNGGRNRYHNKINCVYAYPSKLQEIEMVDEAWSEEEKERGVQVPRTQEHTTAILQYGSQARGEVKTAARQAIELHYGIDATMNQRDIRDKVENLLDRNAFMYKDPNARTGYLLHPILSFLLNKLHFKNKQSNGVTSSEFTVLDGIAAPVIILIWTAILCALHEWQTGAHMDVPFTAAVYEEHYDNIWQAVEDFDQRTRENGIFNRLRKHLLKTARKHAKVDDKAPVFAHKIDITDMEAATAGYDDFDAADEDGSA